MVMKVVKEDISKILARAAITESTQWLSVKKQKEVVLYWNKPLFDQDKVDGIGAESKINNNWENW